MPEEVWASASRSAAARSPRRARANRRRSMPRRFGIPILQSARSSRLTSRGASGLSINMGERHPSTSRARAWTRAMALREVSTDAGYRARRYDVYRRRDSFPAATIIRLWNSGRHDARSRPARNAIGHRRNRRMPKTSPPLTARGRSGSNNRCRLAGLQSLDIAPLGARLIERGDAHLGKAIKHNSALVADFAPARIAARATSLFCCSTTLSARSA